MELELSSILQHPFYIIGILVILVAVYMIINPPQAEQEKAGNKSL